MGKNHFVETIEKPKGNISILETVYKTPTERLDFNWIKNTGSLMLTLVDDLNELAFKNGFFNHDVDKEDMKELNSLYYNRIKTIELINSKVASFNHDQGAYFA